MASSFSTVGLIGRQGTPQILDSLDAVASCLQAHEVAMVVEDATAMLLRNGQNTSAKSKKYQAANRQDLGKSCDLIVVVGGDGSLLGVGRDLAHAGVPVLGINRGGLGFLADIAPAQIEQKIGEVLRGEFVAEDHFLLNARVFSDGVERAQSPALNDVVVHLGGMAKMMEFSLWVDDQFVYDQRSDGVIIASPTGSTAYSLSAGGPIMHPTLDAIVVVPMFPHTLTSRPLVIGGDAEIKVVIGATEQQPQVSCDSQIDFSLSTGDEVRISKYHSPLQLLFPLGHNFYDSCRSKLDWASRLGGSAS